MQIHKRHHLLLSAALCLSFPLLSGCEQAISSTVDSGTELYVAADCALCHGADLAGTVRGPGLLELNSHWERDGLAAYLTQPIAVRSEDERLEKLAREYPNAMWPLEGLSATQLSELAEWLLEDQ